MPAHCSQLLHSRLPQGWTPPVRNPSHHIRVRPSSIPAPDRTLTCRLRSVPYDVCRQLTSNATSTPRCWSLALVAFLRSVLTVVRASLAGDGARLDYDSDEVDRQYEVMTLRIIHRRRCTGFEESKDFPVRQNDVIAGRYRVRLNPLAVIIGKPRLRTALPAGFAIASHLRRRSASWCGFY